MRARNKAAPLISIRSHPSSNERGSGGAAPMSNVIPWVRNARSASSWRWINSGSEAARSSSKSGRQCDLAQRVGSNISSNARPAGSQRTSSESGGPDSMVGGMLPIRLCSDTNVTSPRRGDICVAFCSSHPLRAEIFERVEQGMSQAERPPARAHPATFSSGTCRPVSARRRKLHLCRCARDVGHFCPIEAARRREGAKIRIRVLDSPHNVESHSEAADASISPVAHRVRAPNG